MKILRKSTALILLTAVVSLLLLTACHGTRKVLPKFEVPESFDTSKTYNITFWAKNDSNVTQVEIYENAISDFEAIYPNIKVTLKRYTDYGQIYNDVITNISTGTTPNVCITYPDHIATYTAGQNIVVPLDGLLTDEKFGLGGSEVKFDAPKKDDMIEKFLAEGVIDGVQYAVPFMRSSEACYINKTYVEALGYEVPDILTWDFIFEVSEKAMSKNDDGTFKVNGQRELIPFIYKSTDNMMIQMLAQKDYGYSNERGDIMMFGSDTMEILHTVADAAKTDSFSTFKISSYPGNYFNRGQCIFAVDSTAGATWIGADAPLIDIPREELAEFETVVRPVPQYNTDNIEMISQGPSICIFNKEDTDEVIASWLFVQYLLTDGVQISFSNTEGYVPVTETAQTSEEYLDYLSRSGEDNDEYYRVKLDVTKMLLENIENTFITPVFNGSASLRNAAGQLIEEVVKAVNRGYTVDDEYIKGIYKNIKALYRLKTR